MSARTKPPLSRDLAWACISLNLSVPGWGSLKAGRKFTGIGEMVLVFAGLLLLGAWVLEWLNRIVQSQIGDTLPPVPADWLWKWGIALVSISCVWTIMTCVSLMRQAKAYEREMSQNVPPRLSDLPKPPKLP